MKRRTNFCKAIRKDFIEIITKLINETKSQKLLWSKVENICEGCQFSLTHGDFNLGLSKKYENRNDYIIVLTIKYKNSEGCEFKYSSEDGGYDDVKQLFENVVAYI